jgi:helicase
MNTRRPAGLPPQIGVPEGPVPGGPLHWEKVDRVGSVSPAVPVGTDVRMVVPAGRAYDDHARALAEAGVAVRRVRYLVEGELITAPGMVDGEGADGLVAKPRFVRGAAPEGSVTRLVRDPDAVAAREAFQMLWDSYSPDSVLEWEPVPAGSVGVPEQWLACLAHTDLNPLQAAAATRILAGSGHLLVTAPTGAGKTDVGMLAALHAIYGAGRRAAWLVPQRSLTEELDRELERWRAQGLRVERLSGDVVTDAKKVHEADLWVATTEKFEVLCRSVSMRSALAEVGCLVVDEIHLLGDTERGPVLEALLARVRGLGSPVRIVGLSATTANAGEVAGWLEADLVQTAWRPSRLTWQLPMLPALGYWDDRVQRLRLAVSLTGMVTGDGGSVLVFCGSKKAVRETALAIARDRGASTGRVDAEDLAAVHEICWSVGVGLHYRDWEFKREAEQAFRDRQLDVLVATTTVAAGVNLPARAVVVRDTTLGLDRIDVATVLQMFGRAGRVGAGEGEGWAFLLVDEVERPGWQRQLVDGYTVRSQIREALADHVLAEVAQGRIGTVDDAMSWWQRTLAFHQGDCDVQPVEDGVELLLANGFLRERAGARLKATELGLLTSRLMVSVDDGARIRGALDGAALPASDVDAEGLLIDVVSALVPALAEIQVSDELRPAVARLAREWAPLAGERPGFGCPAGGGDAEFARVVLCQAAWGPEVFRGRARTVKGLPVSMMIPVFEEAPRYLGWLAGQGFLGAVHPWVAVVAADLARRVRWRRLAPSRGAGRLLWAFEQLATPVHAEAEVPPMFRSAVRRRVLSPDWSPEQASPKRCRLDEKGYRAWLRERATEAMPWVTAGDSGRPSVGGVQWMWWADRRYGPADEVTVGVADGVHRVLFTRRGDYCAGGWLEGYSAAVDHPNT